MLYEVITGIPVTDVDGLERYWEVCPKLREVLFQDGQGAQRSTLGLGGIERIHGAQAVGRHIGDGQPQQLMIPPQFKKMGGHPLAQQEVVVQGPGGRIHAAIGVPLADIVGEQVVILGFVSYNFV